MHNFFVKLFSNESLGGEIKLFNVWHILYIVAIIGLIIGFGFLMKNKKIETKRLVLNILAYAVTIIYIADFFIMPLSSGDIDIDKLPFHICTLMAIIVPFAQFNKKFEKIKNIIVTFSIIASLMYITYPGTAIGEIGAFSYKVVQTFAYHGVLLAWGYLNLFFGEVKLNIKTIWRELVGLCIIAVWAAIGNGIYSSPNRHFDWFFITGSTFPFIPSWLMPFVVITATFSMCAIIYGLYYAFIAISNKQKAKKATEQKTEK